MWNYVFVTQEYIQGIRLDAIIGHGISSLIPVGMCDFLGVCISTIVSVMSWSMAATIFVTTADTGVLRDEGFVGKSAALANIDLLERDVSSQVSPIKRLPIELSLS